MGKVNQPTATWEVSQPAPVGLMWQIVAESWSCSFVLQQERCRVSEDDSFFNECIILVFDYQIFFFAAYFPFCWKHTRIHCHRNRSDLCIMSLCSGLRPYCQTNSQSLAANINLCIKLTKKLQRSCTLTVLARICSGLQTTLDKVSSIRCSCHWRWCLENSWKAWLVSLDN